MKQYRYLILATAACCAAMTVGAQTGPSCADLTGLKIDGVEITASTEVLANAPIPPSYPHYAGSVPAHCRVDGIINRRKGATARSSASVSRWLCLRRTRGTATS